MNSQTQLWAQFPTGLLDLPSNAERQSRAKQEYQTLQRERAYLNLEQAESAKRETQEQIEVSKLAAQKMSFQQLMDQKQAELIAISGSDSEKNRASTGSQKESSLRAEVDTYQTQITAITAKEESQKAIIEAIQQTQKSKQAQISAKNKAVSDVSSRILELEMNRSTALQSAGYSKVSRISKWKNPTEKAVLDRFHDITVDHGRSVLEDTGYWEDTDFEFTLQFSPNLFNTHKLLKQVSRQKLKIQYQVIALDETMFFTGLIEEWNKISETKKNITIDIKVAIDGAVTYE